MSLTKILTDGTETGLTAAEKINLGFDQTDENAAALNGTQVITEDITKTVGVGKDFELLHDALRWVESVTQTKGYINLVLDDGVHLLGGEGTFDDWNWTYYDLDHKSLLIKSASSTYTNCIITLDPFDDGDNYPTIFTYNYMYLFFQRITFDMALGGYPYPQNVYLNYSTETYLGSHEMAVKNAQSFEFTRSCVGHLRNSFFDNLAYGVTAQIGSNAKLDGCNISNCNFGIHAQNSSTINLNNTTFTNNTEDTYSPLNEIQYDGSYISDNTVPLQQKGLEVITEATTKTVGVGKDFETLHEALRWIEILTQTNGKITLSLSDGIHTIAPNDEFDEDNWSYYRFLNKSIVITSASGDSEQCFITVDSYDDNDDWRTVVDATYSSVTISKLTVDMKLGGYLYDNMNFLFATTNSNVSIQGVLKNSTAMLSIQKSSTVTLSTVDFISAMIYIAFASKVIIYPHAQHQVTFTDCNDDCIYLYANSIVSGKTAILTNSPSLCNIPLNEIQYDGAYISDGTGPLSFKS